jgi:hypothetical protein
MNLEKKSVYTFKMGNSSNTKMRQRRLAMRDILDEMTVAPFHEKVALIVEPRAHINLVPVITQMANLHPDWFIYLYHGNLNQSYVTTHPELTRLRNDGKLALFHLHIDDINPLTYNALFTTQAFWNTVNAHYALVFQTDAWMCDQADFDLDDFLQYDYVGSPVRQFIVKFLNGGVSLRNVEAMKDMIQTCPDSFFTKGEDVFFSRPCRAIKKRYNVAPRKVAANFSLQQNAFYRSDRTPIAVHKPAVSNKNMLNLEKTCPGVMQMDANYKIK